MATVRPEGLCQGKIPMSPSGIELATFRLLAQCPSSPQYSHDPNYTIPSATDND